MFLILYNFVIDVAKTPTDKAAKAKQRIIRLFDSFTTQENIMVLFLYRKLVHS